MNIRCKKGKSDIEFASMSLFLRIKYTILRKAYVIPPQNRLPSYYGIRFERLRLPLISR